MDPSEQTEHQIKVRDVTHVQASWTERERGEGDRSADDGSAVGPQVSMIGMMTSADILYMSISKF